MVLELPPTTSASSSGVNQRTSCTHSVHQLSVSLRYRRIISFRFVSTTISFSWVYFMMSPFSLLKKCGILRTCSWRGSNNCLANWVTSLAFSILKVLKQVSIFPKIRETSINKQIRHFYKFGSYKLDVNNY